MKEHRGAWWRGNTRRQLERRDALLRRPVRGALTWSLAFFLGMWAFTSFSREPVILTVWITASLGFGIWVIWFARRKAARAGDERA